MNSRSSAPALRPSPRPRASRVSPLYHQVYLHLRQLLTGGEIDRDQPLPSEPALAARYGVSRVTVRKTLEQLQAEGLIDRRRGVGTFARPATGDEGKRDISGLLDNLISYEQSSTAINLEWSEAPAAGAVESFLGPGPCLRIVRIRSYQGQPMSLTTLSLPHRLGALLDRSASADQPVIRSLERAGVIAERAEQVITAVPADALAARNLGVADGAPLICMRRRMTDHERAPVLYQESLYAPDRFEYRMTLSRMSIGPAARWTPTG